MNPDGMLTVTKMADELGEPPRRIDYIIKKHRIKPATRVAMTRLFTQKQLRLIKWYLQDIQIRGQR